MQQKNDALQAQHTDQLNELTTSITKANEKHMRELANLEANFNHVIYFLLNIFNMLCDISLFLLYS